MQPYALNIHLRSPCGITKFVDVQCPVQWYDRIAGFVIHQHGFDFIYGFSNHRRIRDWKRLLLINRVQIGTPHTFHQHNITAWVLEYVGAVTVIFRSLDPLSRFLVLNANQNMCGTIHCHSGTKQKQLCKSNNNKIKFVCFY